MKSHAFLSAAVKLAAIAAALAICCESYAREEAAKAAAKESAAKAEATTEAPSGKEIHGVSLGDYRIRSFHQVDAQKCTVRFTLFATVKDDHFGEVQRLVEEHRQKLRDQVITATRLAPLNVFQEPDLATFRRRVLVRLRRAVPELVIEDLCISEFDLSIKSL